MSQIIGHKLSSVYTILDILKDIHLFIMYFPPFVPYYLLVQMLILLIWAKFNLKDTIKRLLEKLQSSQFIHLQNKETRQCVSSDIPL